MHTRLRTQSYPIFQCQCSCANRHALHHSGLLRTPQVKETFVPVTSGVHCGCTGSGKLDRIGPSIVFFFIL